MNERKDVSHFLEQFNDLTPEEKTDLIKKIMPQFCHTVMENKDLRDKIMQEMMPFCMEMMNKNDFPMKEMMVKMMG